MGLDKEEVNMYLFSCVWGNDAWRNGCEECKNAVTTEYSPRVDAAGVSKIKELAYGKHRII